MIFRTTITMLGILFVIALAPVHGLASNETDFRTCISSGGSGSTCTLDAATYTVSNPFVIGRSNITVQGTYITDYSDTTLKRANGSNTELMSLASGVTGVTISFFYFDGNRAQQNLSTFSVADVNLLPGSGTTVMGTRFVDSPRIALTADDYTLVEYSQFYTAYFFGIWAAGYVSGDPRYQYCDTGTLPTGLSIYDNLFSTVGANAVFIESTYSDITANYFYNNHAEFPFSQPGGQIDVEVCSNYVDIVDNDFWGDHATAHNANSWTIGIEAYGRHLNMFGNSITDHVGPGILLGGVEGTWITDNVNGTAHPNGAIVVNDYYSQGFPGIWILNETSWNRPNSDVAVTAAQSRFHSYGIKVETVGAAINNLTIVYNCLANNGTAISVDNNNNLTGSVTISNNATSGCP